MPRPGRHRSPRAGHAHTPRTVQFPGGHGPAGCRWRTGIVGHPRRNGGTGLRGEFPRREGTASRQGTCPCRRRRTPALPGWDRTRWPRSRCPRGALGTPRRHRAVAAAGLQGVGRVQRPPARAGRAGNRRTGLILRRGRGGIRVSAVVLASAAPGRRGAVTAGPVAGRAFARRAAAFCGVVGLGRLVKSGADGRSRRVPPGSLRDLHHTGPGPAHRFRTGRALACRCWPGHHRACPGRAWPHVRRSRLTRSRPRRRDLHGGRPRRRLTR